MNSTMNQFKITFEDGNIIYTGFNGKIADATAYYIDRYFNFGDTEENPNDKMVKCVSVEQI